MKSVAFDYERPRSIDAVIRLLGEEKVFCKLLAGSQSLGPMLNLRLAQPDLLIDITSIPELTDIANGRDHIDIGACVTHADIEDGRLPDPSRGLLPHVASTIAYRAVRNRGTIGGSLAHADPAADWISVFPLLRAEIIVRSSAGERKITAHFIQGAFTTTLAADEIIESIDVPKLSRAGRYGFYKFCRKTGEFAEASAAAVFDPESGV